MNQFRLTLLSIAITGAFTLKAQAAQIQWATACTSVQSPAIISVSYDTRSQQVTLYRSWPSSQSHTVELFITNRLNPHFEPTVFRSESSNAELPVVFGTKNSLSLIEREHRNDYYCTYYSFDRN